MTLITSHPGLRVKYELHSTTAGRCQPHMQGLGVGRQGRSASKHGDFEFIRKQANISNIYV
eukprot:360286-Chlamydomonas_euryale.AAC.2